MSFALFFCTLAALEPLAPDGGAPRRPSEEELFGAPETAAPSAPRFGEEPKLDDPLDIGGLYYQRFFATSREGVGLTQTTFSAPALLDGYLDARPNERLRAMLTARLRYDPTFDAAAQVASLLGRPIANPSVALDQLWLRFDIARAVFVTAGKQHVKWGAARFWNPTDFLHPVRRDPLALFDERTGTSMVKLHVPYERFGANFYGVALLGDRGESASLGNVGGALRAEWVMGTAEVGADALFQRGQRPRYGADFSSALGPLDIYGEVALRNGPFSRWRQSDELGFVREEEGELSVSGTLGLTWTFAYSDRDTATVGIEYFYNQAGYARSELYPWLLLQGEFQPFYVGKQYAAGYLVLPGPGEWEKASFVLSNLGNLSDGSYVSRLDFNVRVLTHLTVEANASAFYGEPRGEFRLELEVPPALVGGREVSGFTVPAQRLSVGLGLRMEL